MKPLETISVLRAGRPEHTPEAEMSFFDVGADTVTVTLDDGETLSWDKEELQALLGGA